MACHGLCNSNGYGLDQKDWGAKVSMQDVDQLRAPAFCSVGEVICYLHTGKLAFPQEKISRDALTEEKVEQDKVSITLHVNACEMQEEVG